MQLYQIMMQSDDAWETVNELAKLNVIHFIDLNQEKLSYEMKYVKTL